MENIILMGKEYQRYTSKKIVVKEGVLYNKNNEILIYEANDKRVELPSIKTDDEKTFCAELSKLVNMEFSVENITSFLMTIDIYPKFEHINKKLKKYYIKKIREYYSCCVDLDIYSEMVPMKLFDEMYYPKIIPIEEVIERSYLHHKHSHTANALCKFQKIKKR